MTGSREWRARRREGGADAGMTLAELMVVIAISSIVLAMAFAMVASFAKNDARNVVRQSRVDEVRKVGLWLGDALSFAAPQAASGGAAFEVAEPQKMVFTSALGHGTPSSPGAVSRVTVVLGQTCAGSADAGVLRRCVLHPYDGPSGAIAYCPATGTCPKGYREETVMASGVKNQPLFTYYLGAALAPGSGVHDVVKAQVHNIKAVEFMVTVTGASGGKTVESTVFKRYTINEWENW
jgi:prepilin-type N-terminal cleavage/methylation domain-containing protein